MIHFRCFLFLPVFAFVILNASGTAFAQIDLASVRQGIEARRTAIQAIQTELSNPENTPNIAEKQQELRDLVDEAEMAVTELEVEKSDIEAQLVPIVSADSSTQAPETVQGEEPISQDESASTVLRNEERQRLVDRRAQIEASLVQSELNIAEANRLLSDIVAIQRLDALQIAVERRRASIEAAAGVLANKDELPDLLALREQLRALRSEAMAAVEPLRENRSDVRADLERLGPPPEADQPVEPAEITDERKRLSAVLVREDAIIRQAELNVAEANRLLEDIAEARRDAFYSQIFTRGPSIISPQIWEGASSAFLSGFGQFVRSGDEWRAGKSINGTLGRAYIMIGLSVVFGLFLFGPIRYWTNKRLLLGLEQREPTPGRRVIAAIIRVFARAVPGVIAGAIVYEVLRAQGVIIDDNAALARNIWFGILALLAVDAGITASLAPQTPGWRIVPLHTGCIHFIRLFVMGLVLIFFVDRALSVGAPMFGGTQELAILQSGATAISMATIYFMMAFGRFWRLAEGREEVFSDEAKRLYRQLRRGLGGLAAIIILAETIGYSAFAHYLATRLFMLGGIAAGGLFLRTIAHEATRSIDHRLGNRSGASADQEEQQEKLLFFWINVLVDTTILFTLTPVIFLILGADWADVRDVIRDAIFGFRIGSITISVADIFGAAFVFLLILAITRFIQRTAEKQFFPRTRMDMGVRHSLKTMIGYVGLIIALMAGVGLLGFNLSNLAIIAGALSVGIGFGLQSIVNNFVSGLILLFERPIKVGDWIVVSSGEGFVKRISVRSTEIETFDRASIIVPNSELVSSTVQNWTHKDKIGRVIIPVGVAYDSDIQEVEDILISIASDHPDILTYPEPFIYFKGFGDSSLDFEFRGFIRDISKSFKVRSLARKMIFQKFKAAGIEIPFPQRDLHIRTGGSGGGP